MSSKPILSNRFPIDSLLPGNNLPTFRPRGCFEYGTHILNEKAADFTMPLDEEKGVFVIDMAHCPSKSRLIELKHIETYPRYCGHGNILYRRILEPLGFVYEYDMTDCDEARRRLTIRDPLPGEQNASRENAGKSWGKEFE